jgi:hypothetical protein
MIVGNLDASASQTVHMVLKIPATVKQLVLAEVGRTCNPPLTAGRRNTKWIFHDVVEARKQIWNASAINGSQNGSKFGRGVPHLFSILRCTLNRKGVDALVGIEVYRSVENMQVIDPPLGSMGPNCRTAVQLASDGIFRYGTRRFFLLHDIRFDLDSDFRMKLNALLIPLAFAVR